jgi:hypothetical protein
VQVAQVHIDDAFAAMEQKRIGVLIVSSDPFFLTERVKLIVLMARHALPTIFADREQAEAGGLISYGGSRLDAHKRREAVRVAGDTADKISSCNQSKNCKVATYRYSCNHPCPR